MSAPQSLLLRNRRAGASFAAPPPRRTSWICFGSTRDTTTKQAQLRLTNSLCSVTLSLQLQAHPLTCPRISRSQKTSPLTTFGSRTTSLSCSIRSGPGRRDRSTSTSTPKRRRIFCLDTLYHVEPYPNFRFPKRLWSTKAPIFTNARRCVLPLHSTFHGNRCLRATCASGVQANVRVNLVVEGFFLSFLSPWSKLFLGASNWVYV